MSFHGTMPYFRNFSTGVRKSLSRVVMRDGFRRQQEAKPHPAIVNAAPDGQDVVSPDLYSIENLNKFVHEIRRKRIN